MRAYLSGGMEYAAGEGIGWRQEMHQWLESELGHSVFNPNVESQRLFSQEFPAIDFRKAKTEQPDVYKLIADRLVDIDCTEIAERSDYLICLWDQAAARGAGTKGELTMARYFGKPVYLVTSDSFHDIPGWIIGCVSRIFPDFQSLKEYLKTSDLNRPG